MITTITPPTWQDLQFEVARVLAECGFIVAVERVTPTVRGSVEIDVYAEELVRGRRYVVLCECKYWKSAVPRNVVHGFRTVVADTGAHKGYIISMNGFQAGSFMAADATNLELVTWEQFQESFESSWLINCFSPKLLAELNGLMTHSEPFLPLWFPELSDEDKGIFLALKKKHTELGWLLQTLAMHSHTRSNLPYPKLPLIASLGDKFDLKEVPDSIKNAMGYREVLESALEYGGKALAEFRALRDKAVKPSDASAVRRHQA
ncbi:restriction endonuclease [Bradyrhizobium sp. WSM3983]|uniref:restriction endonuclease n=1 Tax=Bradyrhizobium sp. WSM3983 TaxID=1038867 RepID=UPI000688F086|nr:restriction endonuclease [Bradyrhizobium sp. WSM3983]